MKKSNLKKAVLLGLVCSNIFAASAWANGTEIMPAPKEDGNILLVEATKYTLNGAEITGISSYSNIYGGYTAESENVSDNVLTISSGTITGVVYAGYSGNGSTENNTLIWTGGTISGSTISANAIRINGNVTYAGSTGTMTADGAVVLSGGTFTIGTADASSSLTLNVTGGSSGSGRISVAEGKSVSIKSGSGDYISTLIGNIYNGGTLIISNLNVVGTVYTRDTTVGSLNNSLIITGGTVTGVIYGGRSDSGVVRDNKVTLTDVSAQDYVYGGVSQDGFTVANNEVKIIGGIIDERVYGGYTEQSGAVVENYVNVISGEFEDIVIGGRSDSGEVISNSVDIKDGSFSSYIYGGISASGKVISNSVDIEGGTFSSTIYGGGSDSGEVISNSVDIEDGTFSSTIYGGVSVSEEAIGNRVKITGGTFAENIFGGYSTSGDSNYNYILIEGGTFSKKIFGGYAKDSSKNADYNTVVISGSSISFTDGTSYYIYGGNSSGSDTNGKNNAVQISADGVDLSGVKIYGGNKAIATGNTFVINATGVSVKSVNNFENYAFYIPDTITNGGTMLNNTKTITLSASNGILVSPYYGLSSGNTVVLMSKVSSDSVISTPTFDLAPGNSMNGGSVAIESGKLVFTMGDTITCLWNSVQPSSLTGNTVSVSSGSGATVNGGSQENVVAISSGYEGWFNVYGGYTTAQSAYVGNNDVTISGNWTIGDSSYNDTQGEIYGGYSKNGIAADNRVTIDSGKKLTARKSMHIYGGYGGNSADDNTLSINGSLASSFEGIYLYGGYSSNYANGNSVEISGGILGDEYSGCVNVIYGASATNGVSNNKITISGGEINGISSGMKLYAGQSDSGSATSNSVEISGGVLTNVGYFEGGHSYQGDAISNKILISGGSIVGIDTGMGLYGGDGCGSATSNNVEISDNGELTNVKNIVGGCACNNVDVAGNKILITGGSIGGISTGMSLYGGKSYYSSYDGSNGKAAIENEISISGGMLSSTKVIYSGYGWTGASSNKVTISSPDIGTVSGDDIGSVIGGYAVTSGDANSNTVSISTGTYCKNIYGGYAVAGNAGTLVDEEQKGNTVTISGGSFKEDVYGGYAKADGKAAKYNVVNIKGGVVDGSVYGGAAPTAANVTDNTLNWSGGTIKGSAISANAINITGTGAAYLGTSGTMTADGVVTLGGTLTIGTGTTASALAITNGISVATGKTGALVGGSTTDISSLTGGTIINAGTLKISNLNIENAITNNGTVNVTGSGTWSGAVSGAGNLVINGGSTGATLTANESITQTGTNGIKLNNANDKLIIAANNLLSDVTDNKGTVELSGDTLGADYTITGGKIVISESTTAGASDLASTGGITINDGKTLTLNAGNITDTISVESGAGKSGSGEVAIAGTVTDTDNKTVTVNKLTISSGSLTVDPDALVISSGIVNNAEGGLVLNADGALGSTEGITGTGTTTINGGTLTAGAAIVQNITLTNANDKLIIAANNLQGNVTNAGTVELSGDTLGADYTITGGKITISGSVSANASNLAGSVVIDKDQTLTLTGDANANPATGVLGGSISMQSGAGNQTGQVLIDGTITSKYAITANNVTINADRSLDINANLTSTNAVANSGALTISTDNLKSNVENKTDSASVTLDDAEGALTKKVSGGVLNINADVFSVAANIAGKTNIIADEMKLILTGGTTADERKLGGAISLAGTTGKVDIDDAVTSEYAITAYHVTINTGESLDINADLISTNAVANSGALTISAANLKSDVTNSAETASVTLDAGTTLAKKVSGGVLNINESISSAADNIAAKKNTVASGKTLTLTGTSKILGGIIDGAGNVAVGDGSNAASVLATTTQFTNEGTVTLANAGTLVLTDTDGTLNNNLTGSGTLQIGTGSNGAQITSAKTIANAVDIKANASFTNTGTVSGNVTNGGTLTSSIDNLTGTITNNGTFNASGNLTKNIDGAGTTKIDGTLTANDTTTRTIAGTLDLNGGTINMQGSGTVNTLSVGTLSGSGTINFDSAINGASDPTIDSIAVTTSIAKNTTFTLGSVNLTGSSTVEQWSVGKSKTVSLVTGSGLSNLIISGITTTATSDGYSYTFKQAVAANGSVDVIKGYAGTLADIVQNKEKSGYKMGNIATYSLVADYTQTEEDLGEFKGVASDAAARTLTISGNSKAFGGGSKYKGISVRSGDTLNLTNISTISGWKDYVVDNAGTVNISTIGDNVTTLNSVLKGAGTYNLTSGTLTVDTLTNLGMNALSIDSGATLELGSSTDQTLNTTITGGKVKLLGNVLAEGSKLADGAGNEMALNLNGKTLTVISGDINVQVGDNTNKTGTLKISGITTAGDKIYTAIDNDGTLTISAANILNTVDNSGNVVLNAGTLGNCDTIGGIITIGGNVMADPDNLKSAAGIINDTVNQTLTLTDGTLQDNIIGVGTTVITGTVNGNGKNIANKLDVDGGILIVDASNIDGTGNTVTSGTLKLNGGQLDKEVTGAGTTEIIADTTLMANLGTAITVDAEKKLISSANYIGGAVDNKGTVDLTGGALAKAITGGVVNITGDVETIGSNLVAGTESNSLVVSDGEILTISNGNLTRNVTGTTGTTKFTGTSESTATIANKIDINGGVLTINASNIDGTGNTVTSGTLKFNGGQLDNAVTGAGTTEIIADTTLAANLGTAITVDAEKKLTTSANYIGGVVDNKGIVELTGGALAKAITGGVVNITGDVETIGSNLVVGTESNSLVVSDGEILTISNGNLTRNVTGTTGTTKFTGTSESTATIANKLDVSGGVLIINASNIDGTGNIVTSGTLKLNGGQLDNAVTGAGTTEIIADTTLMANLGTAITVDAEKKLTTSANYIGGAVDNKGTVELTGGVLGDYNIVGGALVLTGDITADVKNLQTTKGITNDSNELTLKGSTALLDNITGAGSTVIDGTITSEKEISQSAVKIEANKSLTMTEADLTAAIDNDGTLKINADNLNGDVENSGTVKLTGGALDKVITGGQVQVSGEVTADVENIVTADVTALNGGTLNLAGASFEKKLVAESGGILNLSLVSYLEVEQFSGTGTINIKMGTINDTLYEDKVASGSKLTLVDNGTYMTEAVNVFTEGDTTKADSGAVISKATNKFDFVGGILEITDSSYTLDYLNSATAAVHSLQYGGKNSVTKLKMDGALVNAEKVEVPISTDQASAIGEETIMPQANVESSKVNTLIGSVTTDDVTVTGVEGSINDKQAEGFNVNKLELAEGSNGLVITNNKEVVLGGNNTNTDNNLISVKNTESATVNVVVGVTEDDKVEGTTATNGTLGIGIVGSTKEDGYVLNGSLTVNEDSVVNVNANTTVTGNVTLNDATLNATGGAVTTVGGTLSIQNDAVIDGDVKVSNLDLDDSSMNVAAGSQVVTGNLTAGSTPKEDQTQQSTITGNVTVEGTMKVKEAEVTEEDKSVTILVGDEDNKAVLSVNNVDLGNTVNDEWQKGVIFADPAWSPEVGIEGASNIATNTTYLNGSYIAGRNSVIAFGTTDTQAAIEAFNASQETWGKENITAAVFINKNVSLGTYGDIMVDGSRTTSPGVQENCVVNFAANSMLMVNGSICLDSAAISGIGTVGYYANEQATTLTPGVADSAKLYILGAVKDKTYKILAGTGVNDTLMMWNVENNNIILSDILDVASVSIADGVYSVTTKAKAETPKYFPKTVSGDAYESMMRNAAGDSEAHKFLAAACFSDLPEATKVAILNKNSNMSEELGIMHNHFNVTNISADAVAKHLALDEHTQGREVWAEAIHSKENVSGLGLKNQGNSYDTQYNGTVVGIDLMDNGKTTLGAALTYIDGKATNAGSHNEGKYYGATLYGRTKIGKDAGVQYDISYTHSKNELDMYSGCSYGQITGDQKVNSFSVGARFEKELRTGRSSSFVPHIGARWLRMKAGSFTNSLGNTYSSDATNSLIVPLGLSFKASMHSEGWKMSFLADGGYQWNTGDRDYRQHFSYNGAGNSFDVAFADSCSWYAGMGFEFNKKNFTAGVGYRYAKGESTRQNKWSVNLSWAF